MELIIDRSKWFRGNGSGKSKLLTEDGQMCCLGFMAIQCGIPKEKVENVQAPNTVADTKDVPNTFWQTLLGEESKWRNIENSATCYALMSVNDCENITEEEREIQLTELFGDIGVTPKFIN